MNNETIRLPLPEDNSGIFETLDCGTITTALCQILVTLRTDAYHPAHDGVV